MPRLYRAFLSGAGMQFGRARIGWRAAATSVLALATLHAPAQTSVDGAISGYARDTTGAALVHARVRVESSGTGLGLDAVTGAHGEFLVPHLPPGEYRVTFEYEALRRTVLQGVSVRLGGATAVEASLAVAGVATTVEVDAGAGDGSVFGATGSVVTPEELNLLPLNGRRWQSFTLLTPTANPDADSDAQGSGGLVSLRGLSVTQNSTSVDGASDDQSYGAVPRGTGGDGAAEAEDAAESGTGFGGRAAASFDAAQGARRHTGAAYTFSQEAVREFRVSGQNYSALYGGAAGGVITTVSKSGSNTLHGSGFYQVRSSALAAADPFAIQTNYIDGVVTSETVKPHDLRQQFGGSVGGAAIPEKLFYFAAVDGQVRDFPAVSSPGDPNFYALTPIQTALLGNRGVSAAKIGEALSYLDSLTGTVARTADQDVEFGKIDWQGSEHRRGSVQRGSVQYNRARFRSPGGVSAEPVVDVGRASIGSSFVDLDSVLGRWLWTRSARFSDEARVGYSRDLQYEDASAPLPQEPAIGPGGYAPEVAIGPDGFTFGTPYSLGRTAFPKENKVELADLMTWVRGRNQVQVGGEVAFVHDEIAGLSNAEGAFHYDSGATAGKAGGLVDWITDYTFNVRAYPNGGCPTITAADHLFCFRSFTQSFGQSAVSFGTEEWAGFVEDEWRARPGLTIHAGVRYEYELLPLPLQPNGALDAEFGINAAAFGAAGPNGSGATGVFPEDRNNFGPRLAVAWSPRGEGREVVRIGYGLYYGRLPGATIRSALADTALGTSTTHVQILPSTETDCPQVANQGFGYVCTYVAAPPAAIAATTSAMVFDRRFRLPMVQQASLGLERAVGRGIAVSATYLMNLDRQLPGSVDINIAPSSAMETFQLQGGTGAAGVRDGETFAVPVYIQRRDAGFGPVTDIVSHANATYNALVLEGMRRGRGLEFRASWTWSKALDSAQNMGATPRINGQFDPFELRYDHGLSSLNYPHKVVASVVWEPVLRHGERWMRRAGNGWALSSIFAESSGRPYSLQVFGGTRLTGGHESINGSGGAVYLPTVGRNTLRLPDTARVELRIAKTLREGERVKLRGTMEAFNLLNRVNVTGVQQRAYVAGTEVDGVTPLVFQSAAEVAAEGLNTRPFEEFTGASGQREVQVGVRLEF